jgi:aspartyl/asparaginyl beta-hydroxylase (cupin superfamily)
MTNDKGFYEHDTQFRELITTVEYSSHLILEEAKALNIAADFVAWPDGEDGTWEVFGLNAFGLENPFNIERCPDTWATIQEIQNKLRLNIVTSGFSLLRAKSSIPAHCGHTVYSRHILRLHLGLIIPVQESTDSTRPTCALRVGNDLRAWKQGTCFIFDDMLQHEAWNDGETDRIVLIVDFEYRRDEVEETEEDLVEWNTWKEHMIETVKRFHGISM